MSANVNLELPEPWHGRIATMLLCSSMVALGVALGTTVLVSHMIETLSPMTWSAEGLQQAESYYHSLMWSALAVFGVASVGVVTLETVVQAAETEENK